MTGMGTSCEGLGVRIEDNESRNGTCGMFAYVPVRLAGSPRAFGDATGLMMIEMLCEIYVTDIMSVSHAILCETNFLWGPAFLPAVIRTFVTLLQVCVLPLLVPLPTLPIFIVDVCQICHPS